MLFFKHLGSHKQIKFFSAVEFINVRNMSDHINFVAHQTNESYAYLVF